MSVKLGSTDAFLYLGDQIADRAYIGTTQVPRVLYFNGAVNNGWTTLGNWWFDAAHTVAATSLPAPVDSAVATATIAGGGQTVANFTLIGNQFVGLIQSLTVTGNATFNGGAGTTATITGDATFNDNSFNAGTVNGDATFNDNSFNTGTVTGTITDNR